MTDTSIARRPLGSSGIEVSEVSLGGNTFGPPRLDEATTHQVIHAALDMGVNFVDTAIGYGQGESERFIGRALAGRRDQMVIATKFNFRRMAEGETPEQRILSQAEESLSKLGTDYIDLYQLHNPAGDVPAEVMLPVLDDLVRAGKVRAIGVSNFASWRLAEMVMVAQQTGAPKVATVQNYYHVLARQAEQEVLPYAARHDIGMLPYHPLGGGFLTGKYRYGQPPPEGTRGAAGSGIINKMETPENWEKLRQLEEFVAERGRTVSQLAVAWLLANPQVSSVIAGVSNVDQLAGNVGSASWKLTPEEKAAVDLIVSGPDGPPSQETPPYGNRGG